MEAASGLGGDLPSRDLGSGSQTLTHGAVAGPVGARAAAAGGAPALRVQRLLPLLLQDGLLQRLDPDAGRAGHPALRPAGPQRGEHEDHPVHAAPREVSVRDPHRGSRPGAFQAARALRRGVQPPELAGPAGDDGGAARPLRAHSQEGADVHGHRGPGLLARRHHLHQPQENGRRHRRHVGDGADHAARQRPGLGVPRRNQEPQWLHAALQTRGLPPGRAGPGARDPHRDVLVPRLLQQEGEKIHNGALSDPGAGADAHAGAGPGGGAGADGARAPGHARGLRQPVGGAEPRPGPPCPTVTPPPASWGGACAEWAGPAPATPTRQGSHGPDGVTQRSDTPLLV